MKKVFLLTLGLLLASCAPVISSSSSLLVQDSSFSSLSSSSYSSSTPTQENWSSEELALLSPYFGKYIPPFYEEGYKIITGEDEYGYPYVSFEWKKKEYSAVTAYVSLFLEVGYEDVTSYVSGGVLPGEKVLIYEFLGGSIQAQFGLYDEEYNAIKEGEGTFIVDLFPDVPFPSFPKEEISSWIKEKGSSASLPALEENVESYDLVEAGDSLWIQCFTSTDPSSLYASLLEKNGWVKKEENYISNDSLLALSFAYYPSTSCFTIILEVA